MSFENVSNDTLKHLQQTVPNLVLLDVRTPAEYTGLGHVPGALCRPVQWIEQWAATVAANTTVVVMCEHGRRSVMAAEYLQRAGFTGPLYNLEWGMAEWDGERDYAPDATLQVS